MMSKKINSSQVRHNSNKKVNKLRRKRENWELFRIVQIMVNGGRKIDFKITKRYLS